MKIRGRDRSKITDAKRFLLLRRRVGVLWDCCLVVVASLALFKVLMLLPGRGLSWGQECGQYMGLVKVLVGVKLVYKEEELSEFILLLEGVKLVW
jgi:hypothetical protein